MSYIPEIDFKESSAQEVFSFVVKNLREQGVKSEDFTYGCLYRGPEGTMCAGGFLISDSTYTPFLENKYWNDLVGLNIVSEVHKDLIIHLQEVHDDSDVEEWETGFLRVAQAHNLIYENPKS